MSLCKRRKHRTKKCSKRVFKRRDHHLHQFPNGIVNINMPKLVDQYAKTSIRSYNCQMDGFFGVQYRYISDTPRDRSVKVQKIDANYKNESEDYTVEVVKHLSTSVSKATQFLKEVRMLQFLSSHQNIIELIDLVPPKNPLKFTKLSVVSEFMSTDLKQIFQTKQHFSNLQIEFILYQMLSAVKFMHSAGIVHRNIEPRNILVNGDCTIRLSNFASAKVATNAGPKLSFVHNILTAQDYCMVLSGFCRSTFIPKELINLMSKWCAVQDKVARNGNNSQITSNKRVLQRRNANHFFIPRYYSAPEEILQPNLCATALDMWSVGCIFAELLQMNAQNCSDYQRRKVLFAGKGRYPFDKCVGKQLRIVFDMIGKPSRYEILKYKEESVEIEMSDMGMDSPSATSQLNKLVPRTGQSGMRLLETMLRFDVSKRISADEALKSSYFDAVRDDKFESKHQKIDKFEWEESADINPMSVRAQICAEIAYYNPIWKKRLKAQYKKQRKRVRINQSIPTPSEHLHIADISD